MGIEAIMMLVIWGGISFFGLGYCLLRKWLRKNNTHHNSKSKWIA